MATTTFTNGVTLSDAGWFNDVDYVTYDGATTQVLVGGGAGVLAVWTTATGTGAPVRAGAPTFTSNITFSAASAKLIPGATNFSLRNNADSADNVLISDAGVVTIRAGATITAGGLTVTAGNVAISAGALTVSGQIETIGVTDGSSATRIYAGSSTSFTGSNFKAVGATAAGTGWNLFYGLSGTSVDAIKIYGNGNIQNANNSYGALSDRKLKTDISIAGSQLADVLALSKIMVKFRITTDHGGKLQLGWVAQDVQAISPGLVYSTPDRDQDDNDLGTVTLGMHHSVAYLKAFKATGELIAGWQNHEARIAALEAKVLQ